MNVITASTSIGPFKALRQLGCALCIALLPTLPALAQVNMEFNIQGAGIGIHLSNYPSLVRVPGYPVYYAPRERANYFFYEGLYWVYTDDVWYESRWYNGPWGRVARDEVPLYLLRVPVRYYRQPPAYFRPWRADAPPRWGEHWGPSWAQSRPGWDQWNRRDVPRAAPLPTYQRAYNGARYPDQPQRQEAIRAEHERARPVPRPEATRPLPQATRPAEAARPPPAPPRQEQDRRGNDRGNQGSERGSNRGHDTGNDKGGERGNGPKSGERNRDRP